MKTRTTPLIAPLVLCASLLAAMTTLAESTESSKSLADSKNSRSSQQKEAQMKRSESSSQRQSVSDLQQSSEPADSSEASMQMSGAGRNGPDQAGVSIPTVIDRGIKLAPFRKAKDYCQKQATISLLAQLLRQEVKEAVFAKYSGMDLIVFDVNGHEMHFYLDIPKSEKIVTIFFNLGGSLSPSSLQGQSVPRYRVTPEIEAQLTAANNGKAQFGGGLIFSYETKQDSSYDALGNLIMGEKFVTKYQIKENPIYRQNWDGQIKTQLRLSAEKFKQCLQNQLN